MINFRFKKSDYKELGISEEGLTTIYISNNPTLSHYSNEVKTLIKNFNSEYNWNEMFNYEDVTDRIENSNIMFLLFYLNGPIGYVFFRVLPNYELYLYNLYVTNVIERPKSSPIWFINQIIKELPYYETITCYCDDWNKAAQNVFLSNNFIKE